MTLPKTTWHFILHFVRQQRIYFCLIIISTLIWAANDTFFPYFLKRIVDVLQTHQADRTHIYGVLVNVLVLIVGCWLVTELAMRAQGILQIYTFPKFRAQIRATVFDYVKQHSHEYFSNHFAGNIAKKLADLPTSCQTVLDIICFNFVTGAVGAIIVLVMLLMMHPMFAGIIFAWLVLHLSLTFGFLRYGNQLWEKHADSVSVLSGKIVDVLSNIMNVRLFARGRYEAAYLQSFQADEIHNAKRAMWLNEMMRIGLGLSGLAMIFSTLFLLVHGWINHWVTLGDFTQIGMQMFWLLGWAWYISFQISTFAREWGTIGAALSIVTQGHEVVDAHNAVDLQITRGEIRYEQVNFAYRSGRKVFENFTVTIPAGQRVGLVGFSGSGKSTFVNLILRFYELQSGSILIDDQNIATVTQDSLRAQIAMIPQDPMLFHRSLMDNIRYGRLDATDEEVVQASKLAHCHEFIELLDEGYAALVGERGIKLSGGQRQRIAIARAILKNAPLLILDEATSSLDSVTEKLIQDSLHHLMQGRTTLVIAHRLSTLANMDRILVFDQGAIIEQGTKEELLIKNGHFAKLWNMQTEGFLPKGKA